MKLIRFGNPGNERPGIQLENGQRIDVALFGEDYTEDFFARDGIERLAEWLKFNRDNAPVIDHSVRLGPPVVRPSKLICIGLNYSDHAAESNMQLPVEPIIFFKSTTAITGPNDDIIIPKNSTKTDWEVELAVVIGKKASYIEEKEANNHIAGYMLHNDYSERAFQLERSGQWVKGKSCDTFAPIGPWLATRDEIKDVNNLRLWLTVNGKTYQDGNSKNLIFKIPFIIAYLSQFMTLLPGDIITTGTPAGVGLGQKPSPVYLKVGDVVKLGIDGLGEAKQKLVSWSAS
ncbi:MAG: fumarylacetoacetate hydrolase family protein [Chitinophagaceae bacterium]|nr:fumarylacetoacetate hydrolase family protein [Chitinophagaceae bacterium]